MVSTTHDARISRGTLCDAFADLLSYPFASPTLAARHVLALLSPETEAPKLVRAFTDIIETATLAELQETYTRTFDLDTLRRDEPTCYPYVGHYLFDESHKRGAFILGLKRRFGAAGFVDATGDLPDHLVVLLRFLAVCEDESLADELVDDAILPALARMAAATDSQPAAPTAGPDLGPASAGARAGYLALLRALALALGDGRAVPDQQTLEAEREWAREGDSLGIDRAWCGH